MPPNRGGALANSGAVEQYGPPDREGALANSGAVIQNEPRTHRGALTNSGAVKGLLNDLAKIIPSYDTSSMSSLRQRTLRPCSPRNI